MSGNPEAWETEEDPGFQVVLEGKFLLWDVSSSRSAGSAVGIAFPSGDRRVGPTAQPGFPQVAEFQKRRATLCRL